MSAGKTAGVERIRAALAERQLAWQGAERCAAVVASLAEACAGSLGRGGQVFFCGNGGSASQADHLAAELIGRYALERPPLRGRALVASGAALTALANDFGYDQVFARQIAGEARVGDVLVALSTSGRSPSIVRAIDAARAAGCVVALFTGEHDAADLPRVDHLVAAPSRSTAVIQEMHLFFGHLLCEIVEARLAARPA